MYGRKDRSHSRVNPVSSIISHVIGSPNARLLSDIHGDWSRVSGLDEYNALTHQMEK